MTQLALALAGVAVALLLFFLFTARSLTLNIEAETPPDFSLSGLNWSFGERILVRPGEYVLTVDAVGYHPFEQRVTVTDADTQRLDIVLAPLPGTVSVITTPVGADITLGWLISRACTARKYPVRSWPIQDCRITATLPAMAGPDSGHGTQPRPDGADRVGA